MLPGQYQAKVSILKKKGVNKGSQTKKKSPESNQNTSSFPSLKKGASRTHYVSRAQWYMAGETRCIGGKDDLAREMISI